MKNPKISVIVPVHEMENKKFFLERLVKSLERQTFQDFELVIGEKNLGMAGNTNDAIKRAKGDIIKILFLDDYLAHPNSLNDIVSSWRGGWLVTGCVHDDGLYVGQPHYPEWNDNIHIVNSIGSPSVLAMENDKPLLFDKKMSWMLDCDLYKRLYKRYGLPTILNDLNVTIGIGPHQMTNLLTTEEKTTEVKMMHRRYDKST